MKTIIRIALPQSIKLQLEHGPELPDVRADRGQLEQIILDLTLNAQQSMRSGGVLTIRTYPMSVDARYTRQHPAVRMGAYTVLEIANTGQDLNYEAQRDVAEPLA